MSIVRRRGPRLAKQGAAFGYTRKRGYHPILATRADTGEVLHIRLRKGSANTSRGALRFVEELIARVDARRRDRPEAAARRLGVLDQEDRSPGCERAGWRYSIGVRRQARFRRAIEAIPENAWQPLADYPDDGDAQIAETTLGRQRLIVRRVRSLGAQGELWPDWGHFPFVTNRTDALDARRGRAPPARRRRARDPRPQRPGARALPLRPLLRQRRLDGDRRARAQPAALDPAHRAARHHHPRPRAHPAPPAAHDPRPPGPPRAPHDAADARPLALAPDFIAALAATSARCRHPPDRGRRIRDDHSTTRRPRPARENPEPAPTATASTGPTGTASTQPAHTPAATLPTGRVGR